jgi:WD40 repeat protein
VTVSETKGESFAFFRKKGFDVAHTWQSRYLPGVTEYLLSCPSKIREQALPCEPVGDLPCNVIRIIPNVHWDDIHALKKLADGTFISGSKDGSLYKWSATGERLCSVYEAEPTHRPERNWITAVGIINEAYWVSGERNGRVFLWKTSGEYVREIKLKAPKGDHISNPLNTRRINCFATGLDPARPGFFAGFPTLFDEYNLIEGRTESSTTAHRNDWVYCMHPLTTRSLVVATGGSLGIWNKSDSEWKQGDTLMLEAEHYRDSTGKFQRQFISSLTPLTTGPNQFGLALFGGSVKILDVASRKIVRTWKEHKDRVWSIENICGPTFASCGEDRSVKLWDARQPKSIHTIPNHVGQVTSLLSLNEMTLVAGSCPNQALKSKSGAELRLYDLRK